MGEIKPTLLVLAAGMGSRYGSLKQVDKIGPSGETITDYSIYDAIRAGFGKVVFVIRKSIEADFKEVFQRFEKHIDVEYAFQELDALPSGFAPPADRKKPWGTGHAVLVAASKISTPFAVINADDFYGAQSYKLITDHLIKTANDDKNTYSMVGFELFRTLSEHGHVSRGVCTVNSQSQLEGIVERTKIQRKDGKIVFVESEDKMLPLAENEVVSMNFWGFPVSIFNHLEKQFGDFMKTNKDSATAEFYLPMAVDNIVKAGNAQVKVLRSPDNWFGITYKEDKDMTINRLRDLIDKGIYPSNLWNK